MRIQMDGQVAIIKLSACNHAKITKTFNFLVVKLSGFTVHVRHVNVMHVRILFANPSHDSSSVTECDFPWSVNTNVNWRNERYQVQVLLGTGRIFVPPCCDPQ